MVPHICTVLLVVLLSLHLDATEAECECGKKNPAKHIAGGTESQVHEWPWQVAIRRERGAQFCAGSLISQSWVLTAAHCFDSFNPFNESIEYHRRHNYVSIGEHDRNSGNDTTHTVHRSIKQIIIHRGYEYDDIQHNYINDIAVIQLSKPVEYSQAIRPVCLPTNLRTQLFVGENATVAHWDSTRLLLPYDKYVLDVTHPIISNTECDKMFYSYGFRLRDDQVCTYEEGKRACRGDQGGSLVWLDGTGHYQQIGIVFFLAILCLGDGFWNLYKSH